MLAAVENGSLNDRGSGSTSTAYKHSSGGGDQDLDRPALFQVKRQQHSSMGSINEDDTDTFPVTATTTTSKHEAV